MTNRYKIFIFNIEKKEIWLICSCQSVKYYWEMKIYELISGFKVIYHEFKNQCLNAMELI